MRRAVSIHIGVNQPGGRACTRTVLQHSEDAAWKMAVLASQAGYESLQVLRGRAATRRAVHDALAGAAGQLEAGDNLLVTFSGHGAQGRVQGVNEARDEWWCLYDADLLDDKLAGYWRLFDPGVRIVVISESCFSGGMNRTGDGCYAEAPATDTAVRMRDGSMPGEPVRMRDGSLSMGTPGVRGGMDRGEDPRLAPTGMRGGYDPRSEVPRSRDGGSTAASAPAAPMAGAGGSCIKEAARDALAIRAKVLLLTAAGEKEAANDGVFTDALLDRWDGGRFGGTYCRLFDEVSQEVMAKTRGKQQPQIFIVGAAGPEFALETAFHVPRGSDRDLELTYRGEPGMRGVR